jgi:acetyltransferase-like isoleucine patch superfamily enzyme
MDEALMARSRLSSLLSRLANRLAFFPGQAGRGQVPCALIEINVTLHPTAQIANASGDPGDISVGSFTHVCGQLLTFPNGGKIQIGEWCYIGEGTRIWSQSSVTIGNHVLISHLVDIHDTDGHPIDWQERRQDAEARLTNQMQNLSRRTIAMPVTIEDDVWVCFKATILKGVHVGKGAIIAAGAVVTADVPPWTIVAGNPAKVVRALTEEERRISSAGPVG